MYKTTASLTPTPPFDFEQTLNFVHTFRASPSERNPSSEQVVGGALQRVVSLQGRAVLFRVESVGTLSEPRLKLTLTAAEPLTLELVEAVCDRVRFFLSLDDDLIPFYARAEGDTLFLPVRDALYGYHPFKLLTPFEAACWALVQQRTPNGFAHKTMARFAEAFGPVLEVDGKTLHAFPEAGAMLGTRTDRLLWATNNTRKTERLVSLVRAFAEVDETFLRTAPYDEVARWLKSIKGIGAWSIDFIMLRGLGRYERTPWTDTGLSDAVSHVYTNGLTISRGSALELAERYGWFQGIWAHLLKVYYWAQKDRQT